MHYKNGREAKVGDQVVSRCPHTGKAEAGVLVDVNAQSDTCNGRLVPSSVMNSAPYVTLKDCLHVDDAFTPQQAVLGASETPTPPPGLTEPDKNVAP